MASLKETIAAKIAPAREELRSVLESHGEKTISEVSVRQLYGGLRGVKGLVTETSALDPEEGIRFRGRSIPQLREQLPKASGGEEPLPEGLFYLLLTGDLPSAEDADAIRREWRRREGLPEYVKRTLDALPISTHPMTQFAIGILALQPASLMVRRYTEGIAKSDLWDPALEDAMNLIANLPHVAAYVYRRTYRDGDHLPPGPARLCWSGNFAHMLGFSSPEFAELMRLYLVLHSDHEGGNVSAHAVHLVGSSLSDPYRALASGINGLAGPLHGLANQEVLRWIRQMREALGGGTLTRDQVKKYCWETLSSGRVIPGYGHAVLRQTDPRYLAQRDFAQRHMADDELVQIVAMLYEIVPEILRQQGKAKNPWPNVDAHSGVLLVHYGLVEHEFFPVLFGVSRALGTLSSLVWDRALALPLERPKSVTTEWIRSWAELSATP
ncbi:MAG: citrate (Si)-synthase, eukaryotic [Acidobacteriota bacterium]|nr:MAG: citrate (Si)-synthase, eukaryotic [Acidobacteriota bacterium]